MELRNWLIVIAFLMSIFYGVRANFVEKHTSEYRGDYKRTAMVLNAIYMFIFHFFGSFIGWILIYYLINKMRLYSVITQLGFTDFLLLLFGFLGVTGHLPQALYQFVLSFGKISDIINKKIPK